MSEYTNLLGVDGSYNVPAPVREALADSTQFENKYVRDDGGTLMVGDDEIVVDPSPVAGIDTVGWLRGVFINEGDTVPVGTPSETAVITIPA